MVVQKHLVFSCILPALCCLWLHGFRLVSSSRMTYIVHMDKSVMPEPFLSPLHWYSSLVDSLKSGESSGEFGDRPGIIYAYDNVLHGFSAALSKEELEVLHKSPGFLSAYSDKPVVLDTTYTYEFLSLNPTTGLWPAASYGEDVIVGVVDTGVWPESPSYKDHGMKSVPPKWKGTCEPGQEFNSSLCNLKLIGARYFNRGIRRSFPNISMDSARDTKGHGTHTSSTVGGNFVDNSSFAGYAMGTARGIAPWARLAVYKVIWDEGAVTSDIVAGIDQAVADGVDVISISLGILTILPLYEDPMAIASFGAAEKGVLVSCAAGNSGKNPGSLRNGYPWVVTVAAGTVDRWFAGTLTLGNKSAITGWSLYPGANANVENVTLVYSKSISRCDSSEILSNANGIVICDNVSSVFHQVNISTSTVSGVIFFADNQSIFSSSYLFSNRAVVLGTEYRQEVIDYAVNDPNPSVSITFQQTILGNKPAPAVAYFSSTGPSPIIPHILKPDLMAPGNLILAAWPRNLPIADPGNGIILYGDFKLLSGTSMSCPHVSGLAALLKAAHPEWSPAAIRSAMMTTADTLDNTGCPIKDAGLSFEVATPLAMGAGQINPNKALDPGLVYDVTVQDYINLLCATNFTRNQIASITRTTNFNCSNPSSDLNYPSFIAIYSNQSSSQTTVQTFERTVTNVGLGAATYTAVVKAPDNSTVDVEPKTLRFEKPFQRQTYSLKITYAGAENGYLSHGSLTWIEVRGNRSVRSPIVVLPSFSV